MQASEGFSLPDSPQIHSTQLNQQPFSARTDIKLNTRFLFNSVHIAIALIGAGVGIAAILAFQQLLIQLYFTCWQMALLFSLIGLMVALLFGQCYVGRSQTQATNWSIRSTMAVTLFGLGVVICIMTATLGLS